MISPEKQQLIGVTTGHVGRRELEKTVRASGRIAYDPELVVTQEEFIQAINNEEKIKDSPLQYVIDRAKSLTSAARQKLRLLGMSENDAAREAVKIGGLFVKAGKVEYNKMAYFDAQTKTFRWFSE